jgi:hypothetical protein
LIFKRAEIDFRNAKKIIGSGNTPEEVRNFSKQYQKKNYLF